MSERNESSSMAASTSLFCSWAPGQELYIAGGGRIQGGVGGTVWGERARGMDSEDRALGLDWFPNPHAYEIIIPSLLITGYVTWESCLISKTLVILIYNIEFYNNFLLGML